MSDTENFQQLSIWLTTFNCAKLFPFDKPADTTIRQRQVIEKLLPVEIHHDIYVLSFQELVSIPQALYPGVVSCYLDILAPLVLEHLNNGYHKLTHNESKHFINSKNENQEWSEDTEPLLSHMSGFSVNDNVAGQESHVNGCYKHVGSNSIGATGVIVFAKTDISVLNYATTNVRCGNLYSVLKGATVIQLVIDRNSQRQKLTFISAHLAASEGNRNLKRRINDFTTVMDHVRYSFSKIFDGLVFFCGDLNFRVQPPQPIGLDYTDANVIRTLLDENDELNMIRSQHIALQEFEEPIIEFSPTYKYFTEIDDSLYNFRRQPSWCDRILYSKSAHNLFIKTQNYNAIVRTPALYFSDHQPVVLGVTVNMTSKHFEPFDRQMPRRFEHILGTAVDMLLFIFTWIHCSYGIPGDLVAGVTFLTILYVLLD
ncbi:phosphoinositide 5-phosphatase INP54 Ecym_3554 [Eremothecium cymbalariae DBVPG|uniref:Inositol polyphosphate-related phosphatase domain-containing protein n=1 Tax=Eremothecium cymbalariae (strain CBS 270.75 / DBVPG 7215 / KCTC 17166 / NRRL Y-17582) TaxID=931890 RepID=G8JQP2_ERECY|nr:Hypothetical protein Ecym_3554 [Eremothecium cymbalariae DBVPG\